MVREVSLFRATMPREAWNRGREPRERRRRRHAVDDLIAGLNRYLATRSSDHLFLTELDGGELVRSDYTDRARLVEWAVWAARLSDPYLRHSLAPAPDGSEWHINQRIEYR